MQADTKHQQHDADFGELAGNFNVSDKARGRRTQHDAGEQIADQCRQTNFFRDKAENQCQAEAGGNRRDQRNIVFHSNPFLSVLPRSIKPLVQDTVIAPG